MRCSYYKKSKVAAEEDDTNYRILQDLSKHNWLLNKLKWQDNSRGNNLKNYLQNRNMSDVINLDDMDYQIIDVEETPALVENRTSSLPVSLPVQLFKKPSNKFHTKRDFHATSGPITPDQKGMAAKEIFKGFNKVLPSTRLNIPTEPKEGQYELFNQRANQSNIVAVKNSHINDSKSASNHNKIPRMDNFINGKQTCIKHNLPLSVPPQRGKYKYENRLISNESNRGNIFARKSNKSETETQTDEVTILGEQERKFLDFMVTNSVTVEQMEKIIRSFTSKDVETNTDSVEIDPNNNTNERNREQIMSALEACSFYNKELIALHNRVFIDETFDSSLDKYIDEGTILNLKNAFKLIFGPTFTQFLKNCEEQNRFDSMFSDIIPANSAKKRKTDAAVPIHTNTNKEDSTGQNTSVAKKHLLRAIRKPSICHLPYPNMPPQSTQYPRITEMLMGGNLHRNAPDQQNYIRNQQYQYPCPPTENEISGNSLPVYNPGPQHMQYGSNMINTWNYPRQYAEATQNLRFPYMNGNQMSTRVMPTQEQHNHHQNQVQRNNIRYNMSNYAENDWNYNMRPNGPM